MKSASTGFLILVWKCPGEKQADYISSTAKYLFGTPTSLLLRSDLVRSRDPFFDERYAPFEDGHVCFDLLKTLQFRFCPSGSDIFAPR